MTATIQTVTGAIALDDLGRTLMHEHLLIAFPGSQYDPSAAYDRRDFIAEAVRRLVELRVKFGVSSLVDPCPIELGRDVVAMKEISEKSEVNILCTTGFYYEELGLPSYWRARTTEEIADLYIGEIEKGVGDTGIRPAALKVATGAPFITDQEKKFLAAACIAHKATGVPVITHTTDGVCGEEQQQLFSAGGVAADRLIIGHSCNNADIAYHRRIAQGGSTVGFDQIGMAYYQPDEVRADNIAGLIAEGFGDRIIMSMDRISHNVGKFCFATTPEYLARVEDLRRKGLYQAYSYLFTDFLPLLRQRGVSEQDIDTMLIDNPRRFFTPR
ncbi:phosphotriesterase family protein [Rhizobium sp.]